MTSTFTPSVVAAPKAWAFHVTPWENAFLTRIHSANRVIRIACPFIKLRNIRLILSCIQSDMPTPIHLQVLTRLNVRDCQAFVHDIAAMQLLLDNPLGNGCKVELRVDNCLHAKLYIFDDTETIVTSSNLTYSAFYRNREVALATTDPCIVGVTVEHFHKLFANSARVTSEMVAEVHRRLRGMPAILPEDSVEESRTQPITEVEEHLDSIPFANRVIEAIDNSIQERLAQELVQNTVSLQADTPQEQVDRISENRFYEDVLGRFLNVFDAPIPTMVELATVFAHSSAYPQLSVAIPDRRQAEALEQFGKRALTAIVAQLVAEESSSTSTGESISTKIDYIVSSTHLVMQLNSLGLCRVIVGVGMVGLAADASSTKRAAQRMASSVAFRLTGHLFLTRTWTDLVNTFRRILRLKEEFPFQSYRDEQYKCQLQHECQEQYGAVPEYNITTKEGPDHDTYFTVEVRAGRKHSKVLANGYGCNRKQAETDAAYNALRAMADQAPAVGYLLNPTSFRTRSTGLVGNRGKNCSSGYAALSWPMTFARLRLYLSSMTR
jgi:ribonuclease-3